MEIKLFGYDARGSLVHVLSGNTELVELSKRKNCSYTDIEYPQDGNLYYFNGNSWTMVLEDN